MHQCWSALSPGTHLGLRSEPMRLCALRRLLWRSLEVSDAPVALAVLVSDTSKHKPRSPSEPRLVQPARPGWAKLLCVPRAYSRMQFVAATRPLGRGRKRSSTE
jgi:hypothetical protein